MDKKDFRKLIDEIWPRAKKDLEKGITQARKLIERGEKYVRTATDKGIRNVRSIELQLKKEKLHYELGRLIARISPGKWQKMRKIDRMRQEIKKLDKEISALRTGR